jgi:DNA-binding Lrp family transcriptional regulator
MCCSRLVQELKEKFADNSQSLTRFCTQTLSSANTMLLRKNETPDLSTLEEFVSDKIRAVPNVLVTSTMIIYREHKGKRNRPKTK